MKRSVLALGLTIPTAASSGGDQTTGVSATAGAVNGTSGAAPGTGGHTGLGGDESAQTGGAKSGGGSPVSCAGVAWPTADPTKAGPFSVTADKNVGPLAGVVPDPIYGSDQQRFNVYRPSSLGEGGYCYRDNPEQNPPEYTVRPVYGEA